MGDEWGCRDVTGTEYGRSPSIKAAVEMAEALAQRVGGQVQLTAEADEHYRLAGAAQRGEQPAVPLSPKRPGWGFWARFRRRKR